MMTLAFAIFLVIIDQFLTFIIEELKDTFMMLIVMIILQLISTEHHELLDTFTIFICFKNLTRIVLGLLWSSFIAFRTWNFGIHSKQFTILIYQDEYQIIILLKKFYFLLNKLVCTIAVPFNEWALEIFKPEIAAYSPALIDTLFMVILFFLSWTCLSMKKY